MVVKPNYEKLQVVEQKETNVILWVNTIATIVTGIAALVLAILSYTNGN